MPDNTMEQLMKRLNVIIRNLEKRMKRRVRRDAEFYGLCSQADGRENNVKRLRKEL
jgi:hypothetical protein